MLGAVVTKAGHHDLVVCLSDATRTVRRLFELKLLGKRMFTSNTPGGEGKAVVPLTLSSKTS